MAHCFSEGGPSMHPNTPLFVVSLSVFRPAEYSLLAVSYSHRVGSDTVSPNWCYRFSSLECSDGRGDAIPAPKSHLGHCPPHLGHPPNKKAMGWKWVHVKKHHADGTLKCYKSRLVAWGFTQSYGIDYFEIFSPVTKMATIRLLLALAAHSSWIIRQLDV